MGVRRGGGGGGGGEAEGVNPNGINPIQNGGRKLMNVK